MATVYCHVAPRLEEIVKKPQDAARFYQMHFKGAILVIHPCP
jgi:hypothetical protein